MAEYINREILIKRLEVSPLFLNMKPSGSFIRDGVIDIINKQSVADVVKVVHGRWIFGGYSLKGEKVYKCSKCNYAVANLDEVGMKYCPNCIAKMDGDKNA